MVSSQTSFLKGAKLSGFMECRDGRSVTMDLQTSPCLVLNKCRRKSSIAFTDTVMGLIFRLVDVGCLDLGVISGVMDC